MVVIKRKRTILGRKDNTGVLVKGAKVTPANPDLIDKANAELRKKCARQRINDAEAAVAAKEMYAGATIPIEDATHVQTDPEIIREMDAESIRKSAEQQKNEVGVMEDAKRMIAGSSCEQGPKLIKKL